MTAPNAPSVLWPEDSGRKVPLLVHEHLMHIVWVDVDEGELVDDVIDGWRDDPYDLELKPERAFTGWWEVEPLQHLKIADYEIEGPAGPHFPSGAFTSSEQERWLEYERSRRESA